MRGTKNMKNRILLMSSMIILLGSIGNFAAADDASSGCGLGWEVSKDNTLVSSLGRAITNAIASNTIAMTFGTSGCAKHELVQNDKASLHFAEANFHNLMVEMAEGQGQYVDAFAQTLGCQGSEKIFTQYMQGNYHKIFKTPNTTPFEMLKNVKTQMKKSSLASSCHIA
jgi:hypothetical protein